MRELNSQHNGRIKAWPKEFQDDVDITLAYCKDALGKVQDKRILKYITTIHACHIITGKPIYSALLSTEKEILPAIKPELFGFKYGKNKCTIKSHDHDKKEESLEIKSHPEGLGFQAICHNAPDTNDKEKRKMETYDNAILFQMAKEGCSKEEAMRQISIMFLEEYTDLIRDAVKRNGKRYAPDYKKDIIKTLGSIYLFKITDEKHRSLNYASTDIKSACQYEKLSFEKGQDKKPVISEKDLKEMVDNCNENLLDMVGLQFLFYTCLRWTEFILLRRKSIKIDGDNIEVYVPPEPGCKGGKRDIAILAPRSFRMLLQKYIDKHPMKTKDGLDEEAYMWINPKTRKPLTYSYMYKRLQRIVKRMNLSRKMAEKPLFKTPHHPHRLRHSGCKYYVDHGYTTEQLRFLLGHSEHSDVSARYANPNLETLQKAVEMHREKPSDEEMLTMQKLQKENEAIRKELNEYKNNMPNLIATELKRIIEDGK